eukprot:scaffold6882_cov74-Cyclotella_meneghiniana.AAC.2
MTSIVVWLDAARAEHHNDTDRTKVRGILPATFTSVQLKGPFLRVRSSQRPADAMWQHIPTPCPFPVYHGLYPHPNT